MLRVVCFRWFFGRLCKRRCIQTDTWARIITNTLPYSLTHPVSVISHAFNGGRRGRRQRKTKATNNEEDEVRNLAFYAKSTKEDKKEQRKKMKKEEGS